jgi:hypothetical protein
MDGCPDDRGEGATLKEISEKGQKSLRNLSNHFFKSVKSESQR